MGSAFCLCLRRCVVLQGNGAHAGRRTVRAEPPEDHANYNDYFSRITHKYFGFAHHRNGNVFPTWRTVYGKFQDEKTFLRGVNKSFGDIGNHQGRNRAH